MDYKQYLLILIVIISSTNAKNFSPISYDIDKNAVASTKHEIKVDPLKISREIAKNVDFVKIFKTLRRNRSPEEIRLVGTLGLLSSALKVEESMRENLYELTDDLLETFNKSTPKENMKKLIAIEETINRDKSAVAILNGMLKYARNATTLDALQNDMQHILNEVSDSHSLLTTLHWPFRKRVFVSIIKFLFFIFQTNKKNLI